MKSDHPAGDIAADRIYEAVQTEHRMKKDVKASDGRRKVSKRLMEEAMNYFDECVSMSPFDSLVSQHLRIHIYWLCCCYSSRGRSAFLQQKFKCFNHPLLC